jgi:uncharacterized protein YukJ
MAITNYGALRGRFDRAKREDDDSSPHLQIRVLAGNTPWRVAVNVQSHDRSDIVYWIVDPIANHPILNAVAGLATGFNRVPTDSAHALDFVKAPLFAFAGGRTLPPSGHASADDLQDLLLLHLNQLKTAGGEIVAYGSRFGRNLRKPIDREFGNTSGRNGLHDVHLNQGNPRGSGHARDNGAFHDGGLLLVFPTRTIGIFLAFQSQVIPTDHKGQPAANGRPLRDLIGRGVETPPPPPPPGTGLTVYLERALINPVGPDPGAEIVVLGNRATTPQDLTGWTLQDVAGRTTPLIGAIAAGASRLVALDGTGVQLRNKRGNLLLLDADGNQIDAVTYSSEDANQEGRYVRF